jgi:hypothetical protein
MHELVVTYKAIPMRKSVVLRVIFLPAHQISFQRERLHENSVRIFGQFRHTQKKTNSTQQKKTSMRNRSKMVSKQYDAKE